MLSSRWVRPFSLPLIVAFVALVATTTASAGRPPFGLPEVRKTVAPVYPHRALGTGTDAAVTMTVLVRRDGSLGPATVMSSSAPGLGFEDAALRAVRRWKFAPARSNGEKVDAYTIVQINLVSPEISMEATANAVAQTNWSYLTSRTGGTFLNPIWGFYARWQQDMMSARGVNTHAIAWFLAQQNLISSELYLPSANAPEPGMGGLSASMDRPTEAGQNYRRPSGGYGSAQAVSTPRASSSSMSSMALRPSASRASGTTTSSYRKSGTTSTRRTTTTTKSRTTTTRKK
jgi:TonB family protein